MDKRLYTSTNIAADGEVQIFLGKGPIKPHHFWPEFVVLLQQSLQLNEGLTADTVASDPCILFLAGATLI